MRTDIVVDIETLGTKSDSPIIQIGAIFFDIKTAEVINTFDYVVDIENTMIDVSGSTLRWWLNEDHNLFKDIILNSKNKGCRPIYEILNFLRQDIMSFKELGDVYLWGHGILFDNNIIRTAMEKVGIEYPIDYNKDRDVRTILELACLKEDVTENEFRNKHSVVGVKHDAINDCMNEMKWICEAYNILMN